MPTDPRTHLLHNCGVCSGLTQLTLLSAEAFSIFLFFYIFIQEDVESGLYTTFLHVHQFAYMHFSVTRKKIVIHDRLVQPLD